MNIGRKAAVVLAALAVLLSGCRPYGCDTDQCIREAPYARWKHCYSAYQAGVNVLRDPRSRNNLKGDPDVLTSQAMRYLNSALNEGRTLGLQRDAIYRELERERLAYLRPFTSGAATSAQYDKLVEDTTRCGDAEDM